ncbi:DegT/DnrJ/EryC1/StrS family aminotransferase [Anthocerotibacter panamensis]|uniref:DegT/DnrJ/EryC1/StrS family aminotransferase n=1 Tax=Anthocerotibacter panamensis TaxID=2857077 RepID=UPI001C40162D|nr:DegT/DnrJ/EryC1/StrS family aminotransferase [Anthocerotibacter panamensis]
MTKKRESFLVFGAPTLGAAEVREVVHSLKSGWLGTGPKVTRFEEDFKAYKKANHAIALNSCTAALHLSLLAAGVGPGDEVITTPLTFCATINAIVHTGATPVLADVDPQTMNLDPAQVAAKITPRTRALVPVHFAGRPCPMEELLCLARTHHLTVIEDCAHALETEYRGRKAGTLGDFGCFSFYATKNMTTGEGGMILTPDAEAAARLRRLGLHGLSKDAWKRFADEGYQHYQVLEAGFKYNMMDLQAAIGLHQLQRIERHWERRQQLWQRYMEMLSSLPIGLPASPEPETRHAYHLFTVLIEEARTGVSRDAFLAAMGERRIGVGVHYLSVPEHVFYQQTFGWRPEDYPQAQRIGRQTVSLPFSPRLTDQDIADVLEAVRYSLGLRFPRSLKTLQRGAGVSTRARLKISQG